MKIDFIIMNRQNCLFLVGAIQWMSHLGCKSYHWVMKGHGALQVLSNWSYGWYLLGSSVLSTASLGSGDVNSWNPGKHSCVHD